MDCRADLPENASWGEGCAQGYSNAAADLLRTLAKHPAEPTPARQPSDAAVGEAWDAFSEASETLDQFGLKDGPDPMRTALEAAYSVDAPRPMPTREQVEAVVRKTIFAYFGTYERPVQLITNDVTALLNGGGS